MFGVQPPTGALYRGTPLPAGREGRERACAVVVLKPEMAQDPGRAFTMDDMRAFLTEKGVARHCQPELRRMPTTCIGVGQGVAVLFKAA